VEFEVEFGYSSEATRLPLFPPFGKSDHAVIFLLPKYKQRIVREAVVTRNVKQWSDHTVADLQDAALNGIDWDMFLSSSSDVSVFTDVVTSFIETLEDTIVPTVKVRSFPEIKTVGRWIHPPRPKCLYCLHVACVRPHGRIQSIVL